MRMPNNYGGVVRLDGRRRKPYAVRVTDGYKEMPDGRFVQKYRYIGYFEKRKDAFDLLAQYNAGAVGASRAVGAVGAVAELPQGDQIADDAPTFADIYHKWIAEKMSMKRKLSKSTFRSHNAAFQHLAPLHEKKMRDIGIDDMQACADAVSDMSQSTANNVRIVLNGVTAYAIKRDIVTKNYAQYVRSEYNPEKVRKHLPFTDMEINTLWQHADDADVQVVLIMIYTGLRGSEFLNLENANIHADERYMVAGMKTTAGTNRCIPIHDRILPFVKSRMDGKRKLFFKYAGQPKVANFMHFFDNWWCPLMRRLQMTHAPHDTRHTCATLMAEYAVDSLHRKLILGHTVNDLTERVYTHVKTEALIASINQLP